jgi:hypothetical protein
MVLLVILLLILALDLAAVVAGADTRPGINDKARSI